MSCTFIFFLSRSVIGDREAEYFPCITRRVKMLVGRKAFAFILQEYLSTLITLIYLILCCF